MVSYNLSYHGVITMLIFRYIWRSGKCLKSTATFTIGCKFDEPFRTQFASDNDVFSRLAARRVV